MVQTYKKYGVTTGGYRGERAILKERVIEGLIKPEFSNEILQLDADTEETIVLDRTNMGEDYFIVLPDATTLWPNWKVTIINESNIDCPIYYYTSDYSQLNLFKEVTSGNMTTCILLDNTSSIGVWTTLRTFEQTNADQLEKYTSTVLETTEINYSQLAQDDSDESDEHTTIKISLGKVLAGTALRSVYLKTTEKFTFNTSGNILVNVGTGTVDNHFIDSYILTNDVADNNFTKDYFEEILSTNTDTEIFAYFKGSYLNKLQSGSVQIVVEKAKEINPTVLRNPIVQTQVPIGVIMSYPFVEEDGKAPEGYWRLDGSILPNANSAIPQFVQKLTETNNRLPGPDKLLVGRDEWHQIERNFGSCGKFCWEGGALRFPKINNFIQGLSDLTQLGRIIEAGLPNITGNIGNKVDNGIFEGAFIPGPTRGGVGRFYKSDTTWTTAFDASRSNDKYGKSNTVQPEATRYPYIISIYNKIQSSAELDLEAIIEASVNKVNTNLNNIEYDSVNVLDKMKFVSWAMPNYDAGVVVARNIAFTAPSHGYISFTPINNTSTAVSLNSQISGYISIAGKTVLTSTYYHGHDSSHPDSGFFPISQNEIAFHNMSSGTVYFYPAKGAI